MTLFLPGFGLRRWPRAKALVWLLACALGGASCSREPDSSSRGSGLAAGTSAPFQKAAFGHIEELSQSAAERSAKLDAECRSRMDAVLATPGLPGAPALETARAHVLLYAKAEPVLFVRPPEPDTNPSRAAKTYRSLLRAANSPWSVVQRLWAVFSANPELGRSVLLRDGYLYAEEARLAFALVDRVSAQMLFSDQQIWIHRGERLLTAKRTLGGEYVFTNGAERGQRVRLMLFDRIGAAEPATPPVHRDFRALRQRLGFDRVRGMHLTETRIVADLRYGSVWVPTLLESRGAHLDLVCELIGSESRAGVEQVRLVHLRKERVLLPLRQAILAQVREGLPFDEPRTEYGQQDGQLRPAWAQAYRTGRSYYKMNDDIYYVFNAGGRPLVPQVCVDFVFDTFERASGTWWRPRGQPRERVVGKLDLSTLENVNLRRAESVLELARQRPDHFDLYTVPERERIPFKLGQKLAAHLVERADQYLPGDIVLIKGYAPWDKPWEPPVMHVHSFFIYESDPLNGMPMTLAGNPGRPLLQTWQFEAFRTPKRSIWYRVRPQLDWLEQALLTSPGLPEEPAALVQELAPGPRDADPAQGAG